MKSTHLVHWNCAFKCWIGLDMWGMYVGRYGHWIVFFFSGDEQICWDHNPKSASNSELKGGLKPQASGRYTKGAGGLRGHQPQRWAQMRLALWATQNRLKVLDPQTRFLDCCEYYKWPIFVGSSLCLSFNPFPLRTNSTVYHRFPRWICFGVSPTIGLWNLLFLLVDSIESSIFAGCFSQISLLHTRSPVHSSLGPSIFIFSSTSRIPTFRRWAVCTKPLVRKYSRSYGKPNHHPMSRPTGAIPHWYTQIGDGFYWFIILLGLPHY